MNEGGANGFHSMGPSVFGLDAEPVPEYRRKIAVSVGKCKGDGNRQQKAPAALAGQRDDLVFEVEERQVKDGGEAAETDERIEFFGFVWQGTSPEAYCERKIACNDRTGLILPRNLCIDSLKSDSGDKRNLSNPGVASERVTNQRIDCRADHGPTLDFVGNSRNDPIDHAALYHQHGTFQAADQYFGAVVGKYAIEAVAAIARHDHQIRGGFLRDRK